jgi:hypothetical protein
MRLWKEISHATRGYVLGAYHGLHSANLAAAEITKRSCVLRLPM